MDVVYSHVCGLDVHKKNIVACAITPKGAGAITAYGYSILLASEMEQHSVVHLEAYIYFYNKDRLQKKLNGLCPMEFRTKAA